jgi:hypothetical protein
MTLVIFPVAGVRMVRNGDTTQLKRELRKYQDVGRVRSPGTQWFSHNAVILVTQWGIGADLACPCTNRVSAPHQNDNVTKTIIHPANFPSIFNSSPHYHTMSKTYKKQEADIEKALVYHKSDLKLKFAKLAKIYNIL